MLIWFVVLAVPLMTVIALVFRRSEPHGRGLLVADVPSDVSVAVGNDVLRPCKDEFQPPDSCNPALAPGATRRYRWAVIRGRPIEVWAHRAGGSARFALNPPAEGPTPHLVLDEAAFAWRSPDGTRLDEGNKAVFVDDEGRVLGRVGREIERPE
jgi:hypothetical protein